jgi:hypothetical protein
LIGALTGAVTLRIYADRMEPGIAELLGPREREPKIFRVLWRMQSRPI